MKAIKAKQIIVYWLIGCLLLGLFWIPNISRAETSETIEITQQGDSVSPNNHVILSADQTEDISWQVYVESIENWVTISGQNESSIELTPAMLLSLVSYQDGEVSIRAKSGEEVSETKTIAVYTEDAYVENGMQMMKIEANRAPLAVDGGGGPMLMKTANTTRGADDGGTRDGDEGGEEALTYNIVINYIFTNGELAADPYLATIDAGDDFNESIPIPVLQGYEPYLNGEPATSVDISITDIDRNYSYDVVYHAGQVNYVVEHYLQNAEDDNYSFAYSETLTGYTLDEVGDVAGDFTGFYPLLYNHPQIAADGSTVVQIYYDRYYYLMEFRLEGGTGIDPIYAKYGSSTTIGAPRRNGYSFSGWDTDPPATMPIGGGIYTANWTPADTTFNVLFWYENTTGTDKYSVAGSEELEGTTGDVLDPEDYKDDAFTGRDDVHFVYNPDKSETVTLNGDGTTMVNVYFDRVIITFEFYSSNNYNNLLHTISGRWGSTFSQNGVAWPTDYDWQFARLDGSGGTMGMTFMDAFLPTAAMGTATTVRFYPRTVSGNKIYFLKERLDGTWYQYTPEEGTEGLANNADNVVTSGGTFTFTEKYEGFELQDYQSSGTNYNWTYTQNGQTKNYTGMRYVTTTSTTTTPQYGVVDGELVELEYMTPRVWYLPYTYTPTDNTSGVLYGLLESEYFRLTATSGWIYDGDQTYRGAYVYVPTTATGTTQYYGVVNGAVVPVTFTQGYYYGDNNETQYTQTYKYRQADPIAEGSNGTYYYFANGTMNSANMYYHDGAFYRTRTPIYAETYTESTSNQSGYFYIPDSSSPTGYRQEYLYRSGGNWYYPTYTATTSTGTTTMFGLVDGEYVQLTRQNSGSWLNPNYYWTYGDDDTVYEGTRYTRSRSNNRYNGTRYTLTQTVTGYEYSNPEVAHNRSNTTTYDESTQYYGVVNGELIPLTAITTFRNGNTIYEGPHYTRQNTPSSTTGTVSYYGFVDGEMKPLTYQTGFTIPSGEAYNGQRYTRSNNTSANAYTGTRYVRTNNSFPYSYKRIETSSGTQYGLDSNMGHQQLNSSNSTAGSFYYNGVRYDGTRYVTTNNTTGTMYGFVDGVRYNLSRGSTYTGFGDNWQAAVVGNSISSGNDYIIRYARKAYKVEYYNHSYFLDAEAKNVKYEYSLEDCDIVPEYPYSLPYGMYEFVGWYDNQELMGEPFDFENEIMPANNVTLYAKYEPLRLTVNVYKDLVSMSGGAEPLSTEQVTYGSLATVPDVPENEDYTFVGWFYQNRYGEEMPFQFSSMEVTQNLNIYGKWTSEVLVPYTINYETESGTPVAESITNSALAGSTRTFLAKTDRLLYEDYRTHWFPTVSSHSILMQEDFDNDYTFVYVYRDAVPYTVRYVSNETGEELLPPKVVENNIYLNVTERFRQINGYVPDAFKKSLTLSLNGPNEIIFYYSEDDVRAPYVINHYVQTDDGYELYNYRNGFGTIGTTMTADSISISGYEYNPNAPGTMTSGTVTSEGLELNLYYDRVTYPYKVRYLERNTNRVLAEELTGRGYYEQQLTFNAIDINGYDLVGSDTQTLTIALEETETPRNNVVTFYYRVKQAEIHYEAVGPGTVDNEVEYVSLFGIPVGSAPTAEEGAEFIGWFTDAECTIPVTNGEINANGHLTPGKNSQDQNYSATYYALFRVNSHSLSVSKSVSGSMGSRTEQFEFVLTITGEHAGATGITYTKGQDTGTVTLTNGSYTFTLAHGESIVFGNVPHGAVYSITETIANTHGYTTTVQGDDSGTLEADTSVSFLNTRNVAIPTDTFDKNIPLGVLFGILLLAGVGFFVLHARKKSEDD